MNQNAVYELSDDMFEKLSDSEKNNEFIAVQSKTYFQDAWAHFKKNKLALVSLCFLLVMVALAILVPLLSPYTYDGQDLTLRNDPPSLSHPLGTDKFGRDIFVRLMYGARISLSVGFAAAFINLFLGVVYGGVCGYFGGKLDMVIMRCMDILLAIPNILLAITIVAALGASNLNLIIALTISSVPGFSRIVRGAVLTVRDSEYIEAARAIGAKNARIILSHVLPNCMGPILVQTTLNVGSVILSTAGLSFLGLGVQAPRPEWGAMLSSGRTYIRDYSYITMFPGCMIMITILSLNLLGDGLRDALDPRLK